MIVGYARIPSGKSLEDYDLTFPGCRDKYIDFENSLKNLNKVKMLAKSGKLSELRVLAPFCLGLSVQAVIRNIDFFKKNSKLVFLDRHEPILQEEEAMRLAQFMEDEIKFRAANTMRRQKTRTRAPFGYVTINGRLYFDKRQYKDTRFSVWEVAKMLVTEYLECAHGVRAIAGIWKEKYNFDFPMNIGSYTVWLRKPTLAGALEFPNGELHLGCHEALITMEEFKRVQQKAKSSKSTQSGNQQKKSKYLLKGKIACALCGSGCRRTVGFESTHPKGKMSCAGRNRDKTSCDNVLATDLEAIEQEAIAIVCQSLRQICLYPDKYKLSKNDEINKNKDIEGLRYLSGSLHLLKNDLLKKNAGNLALSIVEKAIIDSESQINFEISQREVNIDSIPVLKYLIENAEEFEKQPPYAPVWTIRWWNSLEDEVRANYLNALVKKVSVQNKNIEEVILEF